jgi:hypothetical protein
MAKTSDLPIYKLTYDLLTLVTQATRNFPKDYKFSLGQKLREECIDMVVYIYRANSSKNKAQYLQILLERLEVVNLIMRLCKDLRLFTVKQFSSMVEITDSLGRQSAGWSKWSSTQALAE